MAYTISREQEGRGNKSTQRDEGDFAVCTAGREDLRMVGSMSMETHMGRFCDIPEQSGDIVVKGH